MTTTFTDAVDALAAEGREPTLHDIHQTIRIGIAERDPANDPIIERLAHYLAFLGTPLLPEEILHEYYNFAPGRWVNWGDATAEQKAAHLERYRGFWFRSDLEHNEVLRDVVRGVFRRREEAQVRAQKQRLRAT